MERPPIDFAKLPSPDLATVPDFAVGPPGDLAERCITPDFDTFATPASYLIDTATLIPAVHIFVCRDAGGLYAMTSICTHAGCELTKNAMRFQCGCHGSRFSLNGAVIMGPARLPLVHHGMLLSAAGTVIVQPCTFVKDTDRYNL